MNVVVDTSVWSLALRRNTPNDATSLVNILRDLIADGRVVLLGVIRQEVLSGIRYSEQFIRLRDYLRAFPDLELTTEDYELAAEFFNTCRSSGFRVPILIFSYVQSLIVAATAFSLMKILIPSALEPSALFSR